MSFMARSPQWSIYYHSLYGQLSTTCSNAIEVAQWVAPSCSWPQPAMDIGVRDGSSNWLAVTPNSLLHGCTPKGPLHGADAVYKSQVLLVGCEGMTFGTLGQHTHGIYLRSDIQDPQGEVD